MINGTFEIGSTGTLSDFFTELKIKLVEIADFEVVESTDISVTFNTNIHEVTLKITDSKITDTSTTTISNILKFEFLKNNISLRSFTMAYISSAVAQTVLASRLIHLIVHKTTNTTVLGFNTYNNLNINISYMFGKTMSNSIADNSATERFFIGDGYYNPQTTSYLSMYCPITYSSSGIVTLSLMLGSSNYIDYIPTMLNCTRVTENRYYMINNKKYYALTSNILVEE